MPATGHTPTHSHSMRFPSVGMEVLSAFIHLFGVSILAFLLAKKIHWSDLSSRQGLSRLTWPRLLVIMTLIDSWLFIFSTGLIVNGAGMEFSETVCLLGILNCIAFYATSKILIYLFLVEKVHVVWSGAYKKKRLRSPMYLTCLGIVSVYLGVAIFLILSRVSYFREDGSCVIGLTRPASLTLLVYDLFINLLLTSLFVWPLLNRKFDTPRIRHVAVRTLWAAAVALTTSCINILVLTIMHGKQLGWVCLASCGTDVVVNAIVLSWVTSAPRSQGGSVTSYEGPGVIDTKPLDTIDATTSCASGAFTSFSRPRALSEPPRPAIRTRIGRISRLFEPRHPAIVQEADPDVEYAGDAVVLEEVKESEGGLEGMYEHSADETFLTEPAPAYSSMSRRSDQSLRQHLNDSQMQIHVSQQTDVVVDDIPVPHSRRLRRWCRRSRNSENRVTITEVKGESD
ncbi:hypothetical protein C2E23DRAFT_890231 [Lenzites betulinus]|nr:hypothetical protein C2E23DRAFT_890231 [Lenzites betulinus]